MVFKLGMSAQRKWRRLRGFAHLAAVIEGVRFQNGLRAATVAALVHEPEEELAVAS
jgi:hypothetical protein